MFCPKCGHSIDSSAQFCQNCGAPVAAPAGNPFQQPQMPMKWYKFLIYFALWAGGILNIINGIMTFFQKSLYIEFAIINFVYSIALIALGAFSIYTRYRLAGFYKNGPQLLLYVYIANAALTVAYSALAYIATPLAPIITDMVSITATVITSAVMVGLNNVYFQKRSHLFTK